MINEPLRLLVVEGYEKQARDELVAGGMTVASDLYAKMLASIAPKATIDIIAPADAQSYVPNYFELRSYDGVAMTGSSLSVLDMNKNSVRAQIELLKEVFELGIPSFGSCWAMQVGVVAAGGKVDINSKGREMGFARKVQLSQNGIKHPMYTGKPSVFDCFASHEDEIVAIPENSTVLSGNSMSKVQALEIQYGKGVMWTVQYHPEYNTHELAALIRCRRQRLINMGFFADEAELEVYCRKLDELHKNPNKKDAAWVLGIDEDILDPSLRQLEAHNWIESLVLPNLNR